MSTAIEASVLERQQPTVEKSGSVHSSKSNFEDEKERGLYNAPVGVVNEIDVGEVFDDVRAIDLDVTVRILPLFSSGLWF